MSRLFKPLIQLLDASGATAGAGTITFFAQGATTLQSTFQDAARTLANENPLTVNGSGLSPAIYLQYKNYTILAQDSDGTTLWEEDFDGRWLADGADYTNSATGGVARTVQSRLEAITFVSDFGVNTTPGTTDMRAIIQLAIDAAKTAGGGIVKGTPGETYRIATTGFTYSALGVTENVGLEMKDGVIFDGQGCKFIRAGVSGDTATNQFWFFGNKTTASTLSDLGVINATFENDGDVNVYVNGVAFFAGDNAKAAGWYTRPIAENLRGIETRVLVKSYDDDSASVVGKILDGRFHNLHVDECAASVLAIQSNDGADISNISADVADFDIINIFKGRRITINGVSGRSVGDFIVNISNTIASAAQIVEEISISNVVGDGDGVRVATTGSSIGILREISFTGLIVPQFSVQQAASGTVSNISCQGIFHNSLSRGVFVSNASDVRIDADVKNPALAGALIQNSPDCVLNGTLDLTGITDKNCLELDRANDFRGDVRMLGGDDGLHIIKATGALGGAEVKIRASGQNSSPVGKDGSALTSTDRLYVTGDWAGQTITYDNIANTLIELQAGYGDTLTIATGVITVTNQMHVVAAQTGTTDDLVTINGGFHGQRLILQPDSGDTITFKHNTGNILMNSAGDVAITTSKVVELVFDGIINDEWIET